MHMLRVLMTGTATMMSSVSGENASAQELPVSWIPIVIIGRIALGGIAWLQLIIVKTMMNARENFTVIHRATGVNFPAQLTSSANTGNTAQTLPLSPYAC